ncbi:MAG: hypothetical protein M3Z21_13115, partial [Pseudomonadota bacterium]|nr:hypothetical protein [Pseudomonadota bacterium]
ARAGLAGDGVSRPRPSVGCGRTPPPTPPAAVPVDGRNRDLIAVVPNAYDPRRPHPLVMAFHGRTNPNTQVRGYYDLERHAGEPTIFLYPSGLPQGDGRSWWNPGDPGDRLRDYALFDALLATFAGRYCVDLSRVFVVGHSLGASFANSLACARGGTIRAAGTVGGGVSASDCRGPVAAVVMHNPHDRLVDFSHGLHVRDMYLSMNGVNGPPDPAPPHDLNCQRYGGPRARHPLLWCPHTQDYTGRGRYYPHTWPEEAGKTIMAFFRSLPPNP